MGQVLHGCATTTEAIRRAIQKSREPEGAVQALWDQSEDRCKNGSSAIRWPISRPARKSQNPHACRSRTRPSSSPFCQHTLLPFCLYALRATIPHLTRSSLHRCLQRHGISRLPDVEDGKGIRRKFKSDPIGYFHIDIAEVRTAMGRLYLFVAIDRTSKFAFTKFARESHEECRSRLPAEPDQGSPLQGSHRSDGQRHPLRRGVKAMIERRSRSGLTPSTWPAPATISIIA